MRIICPVCGEERSHLESLAWHINIWHAAANHRFGCFCGRNFGTHKQLEAHVEEVDIATHYVHYRLLVGEVRQ